MSDSVEPKTRPAGRRGVLRWLPRFGLPRFGLRSLLLLVAAVAPWMSYYTGRQKISETLRALEGLHVFAPELHVRGPDEYACLAIDRDDSIREYHCYLPPNRSYQINLVAIKQIASNGKSVPEFTADIAPGEHRILLDEQSDKLIITIDGQSVFDIPRYRPTRNSVSWSGASEGYRQQWHPIGAPLSLIHLSEMPPGYNWNSPRPGIILWIDQMKSRSPAQETNKASGQKK